MQEIGKRDRKVQLFMRAATNGVITERDWLLCYTVGEFYNEMSLFIEEIEKKEKAMEKLKTK